MGEDGGAVDRCWWASRRDSRWVGSAGRRGSAGGLGVPLTARLTPHTHQLQNASSFFTKEVRDTYQEIQQHNSQPNANKHTFEGMDDEVRVSKRL